MLIKRAGSSAWIVARRDFLPIRRGWEGVSEGSRQFRRQLFGKIIDGLQTRVLTEFWRAMPDWDARQDALRITAPVLAKPLKPESINVPLRGLDPLARDGANRTPCGLARCSASKIDLHLIYGKRLELLAPGLDKDVGCGDDSVDSLDQIFFNRAHVFNRPRCTVN